MNTTTANDFFSPAVEAARRIADQSIALEAESVLSHGATRVLEIRVDASAEARAALLARLVRDDSLGKAFGDGSVFELVDARTTRVEILSLEDGSAVAFLDSPDGPDRAMAALLGRLSVGELNTAPSFLDLPKKPAPRHALLTIDGAELTALVKEEAEPGRRSVHPSEVAFFCEAAPSNPVALKELLVRTWSAARRAAPHPDGESILKAALCWLAGSHPDDDCWPEGVRVSSEGEEIGPKKLAAVFAARLDGREEAVISREELVERFRLARG